MLRWILNRVVKPMLYGMMIVIIVAFIVAAIGKIDTLGVVLFIIGFICLLVASLGSNAQTGGLERHHQHIVNFQRDTREDRVSRMRQSSSFFLMSMTIFLMAIVVFFLN
ncbi:hypothetical protein [Chengkuizengella axinellae]|uniref:DUF3899 domain-containing protein n=1 Tax=Chengkuizengella axinellae TaxID=3064388 RepID=A0ABT9J1A1_9BACL|nr:hypothetical protein [Chengkuizengella sp. 2205SS18-9]MDP5275378.1 hypothetical protein [Chengkuizengella sp. 2205SS18-9]